MSKIAQMADGNTLTFPDETKQEVIDKAAKQYVANKAAASSGNFPAVTPQKQSTNIADFFLDMAKGGGKKLGAWSTAPARALSAFGVPGYENQDYSWTQPKTTGEQWGAGLVGAVPYAASGFGEAALAARATPIIRNFVPGFTGAVSDWLTRGLIGGSGQASAAFLNREDPTVAGVTGAAFPMVAQPVAAASKGLGTALYHGAQNSMLKAMQAGWLNHAPEWVLNKIVNPMLKGKNLLGEDDRTVFWTLRQLWDYKKKMADVHIKARDLERAKKPADFALTYGDVLDASKSAESEFRPIDVSGTKFAAGESDRKAIAKIGELVDDIRKTKIDPGIADISVAFEGKQVLVKDLPINILDRYALLPDASGAVNLVPKAMNIGGTIEILPNFERDTPILFNVLEKFKSEWSGFARTHGKYQGEKVVGQIPEASFDVEAKYQFANKIRELLKNNMPDKWDQLNQQYHLDKELEFLAGQRWMGKAGAQLPLSETMLGEIPANYPSRIVSRGYMKMLHSPGWNSALAHTKYFLSGMAGGIGKVRGFKAGAAANLLFNPEQATTQQSPQRPQLPQPPQNEYGIPVGTIDEGYRYMGGDPSKKESWVKVQ